MLRDVLRSGLERGRGTVVGRSTSSLACRLKPIITFPVSDVELSLWVVVPVGLATGYLDGTIGLGGFVGVPAMIYVFGVPTAVAPGTELYLAIYGGGLAALSYAYEGFVDLRLTCLLFLGSLIGVYIGAYGVKVVSERYIRSRHGDVIILCVVTARGDPRLPAAARPGRLRPQAGPWFNLGSTVMLFAAGIGGAGIILLHVAKAHLERRDPRRRCS